MNLIPGLFSVGEAACVSVHGANRLAEIPCLIWLFLEELQENILQSELKSGGGVDSATKR